MCNGDITRSSSRVDISRVVEISFQILRRQVSGRNDLTPRRRLMIVDVGRATVTVDGWTEFTADHLSARRSTTDLTRRRLVVFAISHRHCIHVATSCVIPFVFIASQDCVSLASLQRDASRRAPTTTRFNEQSYTILSANKTPSAELCSNRKYIYRVRHKNNPLRKTKIS